MKIVVYHSDYGCDTGCCGHRVQVTYDDGRETDTEFTFDHPGKTASLALEFAQKLVRETFGEDHVKNLDWENCQVVDD